jgi:hypothetical protein
MTEDEKRRVIADLLTRAETAERSRPTPPRVGVTMLPQWHRDRRVE